MSQPESPSWYRPGDLEGSIRAAMNTDDVTIDDVVDVLQDCEFQASRDRIRRAVESACDRIEAMDAQTDPSLEQPRSLAARFVSVDDIEYLGSRDFARILGIALSSYDGNYRIPNQEEDLAVNLIWNRQHESIALRAVSRPSDSPASVDAIRKVKKGETSPTTGRSPSVLAVASNTGFTPNARGLAEENDIEIFGQEWLMHRFGEVRLTWDVVGPIIERGGEGEDPLADLEMEREALPAPLSDVEPLIDVPEETGIEIVDADPQSDPVQSEVSSVSETEEPGQHGVLYADPDEDGDYDALDRFAESIGADDS